MLHYLFYTTLVFSSKHSTSVIFTGREIGEEFRNRKGYFSLNVQAICDADLRFMNVVARWPGSAHDATIFNNSVLRGKCLHTYQCFNLVIFYVTIDIFVSAAQCDAGQFGNRWMLGDSAYPNRPYLLTPILNPTSVAEHQYNKAHIKTRNTIERYFYSILCEDYDNLFKLLLQTLIFFV